MYHGVDFWKIVLGWSLRLDRLNSFVRGWDSSSKTLRLTVGSGVFNWRAAAERLPVSIDISDVAFS